jgi:eukaryotic translation initiation factor 2C
VTAPVPSSAPTPAEVEAMRRQVERKVVVAEAQAGPRQGSSSSQAPAPRPAMQGKAPCQFAPAGSPLSFPAQSPASFQAPAVRPAMQGKPPGQVAPTASPSSFPALAPVQGPTPERPAMQQAGKPPGQVAPAVRPSSLPAPVQGPAPGRPAMQVRPPAGQVAPASGPQIQGKAPAGQVALSAPAGTLPPASSKAMVFPARPGYGTVGRRCRVRANHVHVQLADTDIYHYDVRIYMTPICVSLLFLASAPCK